MDKLKPFRALDVTFSKSEPWFQQGQLILLSAFPGGGGGAGGGVMVATNWAGQSSLLYPWPEIPASIGTVDPQMFPSQP